MVLFSKKKRSVIVEESSIEQTESAVCKDNALGNVAPKMSVNLTWLLPLIPLDPWHNILVQ